MAARLTTTTTYENKSKGRSSSTSGTLLFLDLVERDSYSRSLIIKSLPSNFEVVLARAHWARCSCLIRDRKNWAKPHRIKMTVNARAQFVYVHQWGMVWGRMYELWYPGANDEFRPGKCRTWTYTRQLHDKRLIENHRVNSIIQTNAEVYLTARRVG